MSVAKVTELSVTSSKSFEDAIQQGIDRATKTLVAIERHVRRHFALGRAEGERQGRERMIRLREPIGEPLRARLLRERIAAEDDFLEPACEQLVELGP